MAKRTATCSDVLHAIESGRLRVDTRTGSVLVCRSPRTPRWRPVRPEVIGGYLRVGFGVRFRCLVHRMVWFVARGEIPDGLELNHLDGVKTNNAITNLELVTRSGNLAHAYRIGLIRTNKVTRIPTAVVHEIRASTEPQRVLAERFAIGQATVCRIRSGASLAWVV